MSDFPKRHRQLRVKDLAKVPRWRLEQDSNPWPFGWKAKESTNQKKMSHHSPLSIKSWLVLVCQTDSGIMTPLCEEEININHLAASRPTQQPLCLKDKSNNVNLASPLKLWPDTYHWSLTRPISSPLTHIDIKDHLSDINNLLTEEKTVKSLSFQACLSPSTGIHWNKYNQKNICLWQQSMHLLSFT